MISKKYNSIFILIVVLLSCIISYELVFAQIGVGQRVAPTVLQDYRGGNINLANSIGQRATVIWVCDTCRVCASGFDNFKSLHAVYGNRGVDFYIISTVDARLTAQFVQANQITAPVLLGGADPLTSALTGQGGYGICPMDNIFVVDRTGVLRFRGHLPGVTNRELQNAITQSQ